MSDVQVKVREDGSIVIPPEQVAGLGFKPGEQLAVSLVHRARRPSFGLLRGKLPDVDAQFFESVKADRTAGFEAHRNL